MLLFTQYHKAFLSFRMLLLRWYFKQIRNFSMSHDMNCSRSFLHYCSHDRRLLLPDSILVCRFLYYHSPKSSSTLFILHGATSLRHTHSQDRLDSEVVYSVIFLQIILHTTCERTHDILRGFSFGASPSTKLWVQCENKETLSKKNSGLLWNATQNYYRSLFVNVSTRRTVQKFVGPTADHSQTLSWFGFNDSVFWGKFNN